MAPDQESDARAVVEDLQVVLSDEVCGLNVAELDLPRTVAITNGVPKSEENEIDKVIDKEESIDGIPTPNILLHQPEDVCLEWLKVQKVGAGLANLGNTCFLNTVIQCLTYCPPLANYLLQEDHSATCKNFEFCMICELAKHIKQVFQRPGDVIKPLVIHQNLKFIADHFQFGRQEDAHEFLRFVIENLWRASLSSHCEDQMLDPASRETTIINHIFGGYNRSQVRCLRCKKKSDKYEHFMDFILDIKHNSHTLEKALENFVKPEILENDNAYNCPKCKALVQAEKRFTIHRAPNVATIQLKRFDYNRSCGGKVTKHISYPERLNLRPYMSEKKDCPLIYKLNAVLVHSGQSCTSGHYYCYIRNSNDYWYLMDDARVQRVSLREVLNQQAYVLFYLRFPIKNGTHFKKNGIIPILKEESASKNFNSSNCHSPLRSRPQRPFTLNLNKRQATGENDSHQKTHNFHLFPNNDHGTSNGHDKQNSYPYHNGNDTSYNHNGYANTRKNEASEFRSMKHIPAKYYNYSKRTDSYASGKPMCPAETCALKTYANQSYLTDSNFMPKVNGGPSTFYNFKNGSSYDNCNGHNSAQSKANENCFQVYSQDFSTDEQFNSHDDNRFVNGDVNGLNQLQYNSNNWSHNHKMFKFNRTSNGNFSGSGEFHHRKSFSAPYYNPYSYTKNNSFYHNGSVDGSYTERKPFGKTFWNGNCSSTQNPYGKGNNFYNGKQRNSGYNGNRWNNGYKYGRYHYNRRKFNRMNNKGYNGNLHKQYKFVNGFQTCSQEGMRNHPYRPVEMANHGFSF